MKNSYILSISEWSAALENLLKSIVPLIFDLSDREIEFLEGSLSVKSSLLTYEIVENLIHDNLSWMKTTTNYVDIITKSINTILELSNKDYRDIQWSNDQLDELVQYIDPLYCMMASWVSERTSNPWMVWDVQLRGDTLFIMEIEDYRIQYYYQHVENEVPA